MTIILTNDDGIDAPGIQALSEAIDGEGIFVAPRDHQSGCGHQVTTMKGIQVDRRAETRYAIAGTPADCVRVAINHLFDEVKWVLSGINAGGNLGSDVYISGTVAAVREAAFYRIPAIALSQRKKPGLTYDWDCSTFWARKIIPMLMNREYLPGTYWNVNLPHLAPGDRDPEIIFCEPCTQPLPGDFRLEGEELFYCGDYASRKRDRGSDVDVCLSGDISITLLKV